MKELSPEERARKERLSRVLLMAGLACLTLALALLVAANVLQSIARGG